MLKHGDIIEIKLSPYFKKETFYGKVIDYSYIFYCSDRDRLFIHVFSSYEELINKPHHLYTNPIPIKSLMIILDYEPRLKLVNNIKVSETEFVRNMMFRSANPFMPGKEVSPWSVEALELGLSTLDFEYEQKKVCHLEFLCYYYFGNIVERIVVEKLKYDNISATIFKGIIPKYKYVEFIEILHLYIGSKPYRLQAPKHRNYIEIDWSILENSKHNDSFLTKMKDKGKHKFWIFCEFLFKFYKYDSLFLKYNFRAISYYWVALYKYILENDFLEIGILFKDDIYVDIKDNTRFSIQFINEDDRNKFYDYISALLLDKKRLEAYLKKLSKRQDILDQVLYKHPSLIEDFEEIDLDEVKVESLDTSNVYLNLFKHSYKNRIEYCIEVDVEVFYNNHTSVSSGDIFINGDEVVEKMKPIIKSILNLKRVNFVTDGEASFASFIFKDKEQYKMVKKYFDDSLKSNKKVEAWLKENFG